MGNQFSMSLQFMNLKENQKTPFNFMNLYKKLNL